MDKHSLPSIEQIAAFLDGNLPESEMKQFSQLAEHDDTLRQLLDASSVVDKTLADFTESDLQLPPEIAGTDFEFPDIDNANFLSLAGDSFSENDHLYQQESIDAGENYQQESETFNKREFMATNYRTYGEAGENFYDPIYIKQPDDHSCGLRSQQIVLRDFGIDIPFADLERYALDAGVYSENGTYTYDIGKVLEMAGVGMHQVEGSTIYDLTNELAQGHRVIVSVDANELWYNDSTDDKLKNWFDDVFGDQGGNHALIVAGVEVNPNNPDDVKVVLTDPGAGQLRIEYPLNQFMDAWKDSNCFMAATDCPAPYQYDAATGREVPSNFYVEHSYNNQFVVDNGYQLNPDEINILTDYQPVYNGHLALIGDITYEDYLSQHPSLSHVGNSYTSHGGGLPLDDNQIHNPSNFIDDPQPFNEDDSSLAETTGGVGLGHLRETTGGVGLGDSTGSVGSLNPDDMSDDSFNSGL